MEYQIILPEIIGDEWQNIGIDFEPQSITGNIKGENIDKPIINLKKYAIYLDNRYLKDYKIIKEETKTILNFIFLILSMISINPFST
jgi:hypothetical protein